MPKLKPMKDAKEIAAVPTNEPVLVVLEPPATSAAAEDGEGDGLDIQAEPERRVRAKPAEDGVEQLKAQLDASKAALANSNRERDEAAKKAADAARELTAARAQSADSEADAVASGLAAAQAQSDQAEADAASAFESGDAKKLAEANKRLGRSAADIREFERAAATLADRKETAKIEAARPAVEAKQPSDVNEVIDKMQLMPTERDWLKAHPDALMDRSRNVELDAAYIKATRKGLVRGTDKYFKFIETEMGYAADEPEPDADSNNDDNERTPIVAAPVSRENRSSMSNQPANGNRVVLSPEQREFAKTMGISDVQYATGVLRLKKEKQENPERYASRG